MNLYFPDPLVVEMIKSFVQILTLVAAAVVIVLTLRFLGSRLDQRAVDKKPLDRLSDHEIEAGIERLISESYKGFDAMHRPS